jgi:hypothetical protein
MVKCERCGRETELHYTGNPICTECMEGSGSLAKANAVLNAARDAYQNALAAQREAEELLEKATKHAAAARDRYHAALEEFTKITSAKQ